MTKRLDTLVEKENNKLKEQMYNEITARIEQAEKSIDFTEPQYGYIMGLIDYHSHLEKNKQIISGLKDRLNEA